MKRGVESPSYKREEDSGSQVLIPSHILHPFTHISTTFLPPVALTPPTPAGLVMLRRYATGAGNFISRMDARNHIMDAIEDPYPTNQDVGRPFSPWRVR
jgi:hypothetical protein